jgi:hypothetical protein
MALCGTPGRGKGVLLNDCTQVVLQTRFLAALYQERLFKKVGFWEGDAPGGEQGRHPCHRRVGSSGCPHGLARI